MYFRLLSYAFSSRMNLSQTNRSDQVQDGKYFQAADEHFCHGGELQETGKAGVIGYRAHLTESGADIANAGDGGCDACSKIQASGNVDSGEQYNDH